MILYFKTFEFMSWGLRGVSICFFLVGNRHTFYLSHLSTSKQNYHLFLTSLDSIHCLATLCLRRYAAHQLDLERSWKHSSLRRVTFFKLKTLRVTFAPGWHTFNPGDPLIRARFWNFWDVAIWGAKPNGWYEHGNDGAFTPETWHTLEINHLRW